MPTCLPPRADDTRGRRLLASVAIALLLVVLIETTLATPPQAGEFPSITQATDRS